MNSALVDDFLNESSFLGKFCSIYMNKQEFKLYLSMIINPLILSIDNENDECLDLSLISIRDYIKNKNKEKKNNKNIDNLRDILFNEIPKTKIIFKKNNELEAELEEESQRKNNNDLQRKENEENNNVINENKEEEKYNENYKEDLTLEKINSIISHEKNKDIKDFYLYQLEQINSDTDIFSNQGLLDVLKEQCFDENKEELVNKYKSNFLFIQKKIDFLLQTLIDKISTIPYTIRCICKIIYLLISKKFPLLPKYLRNSFVGKFIFEKSIFPVLSLENRNILENISEYQN